MILFAKVLGFNPWFQKCCNIKPPKIKVLLITPLLDSGIDFKVLVTRAPKAIVKKKFVILASIEKGGL
jgi:hypothetical protein